MDFETLEDKLNEIIKRLIVLAEKVNALDR